MNQFLNAVACEKLDSDEEDLNAFAEPPKCKCAAHASNISGSAALLTLSSSKSFEMLPVEVSLDDDEDGSSNWTLALNQVRIPVRNLTWN